MARYLISILTCHAWAQMFVKSKCFFNFQYYDLSYKIFDYCIQIEINKNLKSGIISERNKNIYPIFL
jgi:hypothetical protein